jgi:hypothetical protein
MREVGQEPTVSIVGNACVTDYVVCILLTTCYSLLPPYPLLTFNARDQ